MLDCMGREKSLPVSISLKMLPLCCLSILALYPGCATKSGSGSSEERQVREERISDPAIKEIPQRDAGITASRTSPTMSTEMAARNSAGLSKSYLLDVLFDFDQASLRPDAFTMLETNVKRLKEDGGKRVLLEGRADEIGTSAYNIVLGDRRAKSVRSYLQQLGLVVEFNITSYGKDRPLCFEHNKECWQRNRSVHFVVKE